MLKIKEKWNERIPMDPDGRKFSLKFPNSMKIECSIRNATPKVIMFVMILYIQDLYEIAFGFGSCLGPFRIYSIIPRQAIDYDDKFDAVDVPLALAVENEEEATDLLDIISDSVVSLHALSLQDQGRCSVCVLCVSGVKGFIRSLIITA